MSLMLKRYIVFFVSLFSFLGVSFVQAQNKVVTGTVVEIIDEASEPILGANVVFVDRSDRYLTGAITDLDGNYNVAVPSDAKDLRIRFSYIGMKTQTLEYTGQKVLNVTMSSEAGQLDEVQIVAKKVERNDMGISFLEQTSATQKVNMAEIVEGSPVSSIEEALQGQLAGVDIVVGGDPGARSTIRIRGINSLNASSEPLIVVNGIPYSVDIDDDFNFATANDEDFGALLNIAPSDIESIEVLKDAAATAIYGTKGANGVLLINTKQGSKGKTRFSFSSKFTAKFEPNPIPLLDGHQYVSLMQDAIWNSANAKGLISANNELDLLYDTYDINYNPDWMYFDEYNCDTKWLDYVRQQAYTTDNTFSIDGGGDKATYRLSLGYLNEMGTTIGTGLERFNANYRMTYDFSDRLRMNTEFAFTQTDKEGNATTSVRSEAQRKMPNKSPYYIDDATGEPLPTYFNRQEEDFQGSFSGSLGSSAKNFNPVAMVDLGFNNVVQREERITFNAQYTFPFDLIYKGYVSMNMKTVKTRGFLPQEATGVLWTSNSANLSKDAYSDNLSLQTEQKLLYNHTFFEKHQILATALARLKQNENYSYSSFTSGNPSSGLSDPVAGSVVTSAGSGYSKTRSVEMIGQFNYTFDGRYVANVTINREGNSAMGKNNRFATFPAFGLAWNVHREHWFDEKEEPWLTEGKIRLSLGWSGNAPSGSSLYLGAYQTLGEFMNMSAIYPVRIQLDKLKWEVSKEWNYGFDVRVFDKLGFTFDYYDKYTSDLLLSNVKIPSSTGYSTIRWYNSGELSNKGYEFRVTYDAINSKIWKLSFNFNISHNENKVEKLPVNMTEENYTFGNGNYAIRVVEGDPIGSFYGYRYLGVYDNKEETYARDAAGNVMFDYKGAAIVMKNGTTTAFPGDAKYEDINHDGVINEYDIVYLGNSNPMFTGGAGFTLKYKDWSLTTFFYDRLGQKIINTARMNLESMYNTNNQSTAVLRRWRSEGDAENTDIPRALYGMGYNYLGSDRFVEDASFIRLKTLSLNYNLPKKSLEKLGINRLQVFVTGYDLFTWTSYSGQDPEVSMPSKATSLAQDNSTSPVTKRAAVGINLNF